MFYLYACVIGTNCACAVIRRGSVAKRRQYSRSEGSTMTEERHSGHTPPAFTSFIDEAIPSTNREGAADTSSTFDDYTTILDEARAYPWNTLNSPTDAICIHGHRGMNENGNTAYRIPVSTRGDNEVKPNTSLAGMEDSSAISEDDATIPDGTWGRQQNVQYYPDDVTSTIYGHTDMAGKGSTGYRPPVCSSGGDDAIPSTSHAGMEEASASLENNRRNATGTEESEQQELCGVCGVCSKVYTRLHTLHRHATEHYGDESYICEACHLPSVKITKSVRLCQKSTREKLYKCETCGKSFKIPSHLKIHQRTHTGMKPYNCETCGKSFAQSAHLNAHKRTHTGVTPYRCETCGKLFKMLSHLNVHQRMHTGVSPYRCKTCGKSFKQLSHLNVHERTHTGEKLHVCPKCMKSFQSKRSLKEHFNLHTGAKPFVCQICSKAFWNSSTLRTHGLRHMDGSLNQWAHYGARFAERETLDGHMCEMVTCYLCGDSFIDDIQLATHLVKHRDGQPKQ